MHDLRALRADPDALKRAMLRRGKPEEAEKVEAVLRLDADHRKALTAKENLLAQRNAASKAIGAALAAKDMARAEALKAEVAAGKEALAALEGETARLEKEIHDLLAGIPNIPQEDVPDGADEQANVEYPFADRVKVADIPGFTLPIPAKRLETGRDHVDLGEALGGIDFESAAKLSGSRFVVTKGPIARLERALGQFMLDLHTSEHGYTEVNPPILVKDEAMFGTAQLPKFAEDQFAGTPPLSFAIDFTSRIMLGDFDGFINSFKEHHRKYFEETSNVIKNEASISIEISKKSGSHRIEFFDLLRPIANATPYRWLIPTAEVPLTNLVREKILSEEELPLRFTALTPCFRAEAGSAGRDTRGMLRQHQFNKVELVSITTPEKSAEEHERMLACAETVLKRLGLHYRVRKLSTGDMGFASRKTYDIEVWLPGQGAYREISSCSVCGDFQARRMAARFRRAGEKETRFVHTLNGSGVALGRCLIAVMENYQDGDGAIAVPDALQPYMGGITRIGRA